MTLDKTDIAHIAKLARLELTEEETERYASELSVVFEYFSMLGEVDVTGVEETTQVTGLTNVVRDDMPEQITADMREDMLAAFPQRNGELLTVKAVFGGDED
jgi:aspartyl-tRNA(Asn)/glutamyl-tRNA(Gln) amidotransferase subunit C